MKNRKLFAIITLVAFMLTMMPLMAFATSASGSSISVDDSSAKANGTDALEFILDVDEAFTGDQKIVVFAERSGSMSDCDTIALKNGNAATDAGAGYIVFAAGDGLSLGENVLTVKSTVAGTVALKAYVVTGWDGVKIAEVYNGSTDIIKKALVGNGCTGKFTATDNTISADVTVTDKSGVVASVDKDGQYIGAKANNGVDYYKVSMKFDKGGSKLVGEDVTISVDKNGATLNKEEATTSATGKIDFKVSATKEGTYTVTVDCGTFSKEYKFVFAAAQIDKVDITYTVGGTIAVGETETVAMSVVAYDSNGNAVPADTAINQLGNFKAEVIAAPADSSLEDEEVAGGFVYKPATSDNIYLSFTPDAEGEYTIKIYNEVTGVADTTTIKAAEFGVADHATISYPASTYALGERTQNATVYLYDQNGVKKLVKPANKNFSYSGLGVAAFDSKTGQVTFKNDNDYVGNEIVVSVVANNKYAASTTLTIGAEAAALTFTDATGAVGEDVVVNAKVVDVNGNVTAITSSDKYDVAVQSAIIIEKPAGAAVSVDADYFKDSMTTFLKKGTGKVTLTSNKEGTVKANIVLALTNKETVTIDGKDYAPGKYTFYLSGVATATFGAVAPSDGISSTVTLIIGSNTFVANGSAYTSDVAPYVVNGRTFVPVRAFAEATGAKVEYDAATQVITITAEGLTAQMTIGSNILTVNGETVVMDAAAAVTAEGRTVLPVRYAGQALGYDFECAYGANGAVTSVTMFK